MKDIYIDIKEEQDYLDSLGTCIHVCNISPETLPTYDILNPQHLDTYVNLIAGLGGRHPEEDMSEERAVAMEYYQQVYGLYGNESFKNEDHEWDKNIRNHIVLLDIILVHEPDEEFKQFSYDLRKFLILKFPELFI